MHTDELSKLKKQLDQLKSENADLKNSIAKINAQHHALDLEHQLLSKKHEKYKKLVFVQLIKPLIKFVQLLHALNAYRKGFRYLKKEKGSFGKACQFVRRYYKANGFKSTKIFLKSTKHPLNAISVDCSALAELDLLQNSGKETIILAMPTVSDLSYLMRDGLEHLGYSVILFNPFAPLSSNRKYPNFSSRCYAKYRKIFFNDRETGRRLKEQSSFVELNKMLQNISGKTHSIFIRSDLFSIEFIKAVTTSCNGSSISYQFDGLSRYPLIYERIPLFDRFYVFDPEDLQAVDHPLMPATNFYFEHTINANTKAEYDFYYVGAHHPSRYHLVSSFAKFIEENGWTASFNVYPLDIQGSEKNYYPNSNINILDDIIPFSTNTKLSQKARILVDFVINEHSGLSFRTFEAVGYQKKLITTNEKIALYDFYHPNNIFIWNGKDFEGIREFINLPYHKLPDEVYKKYGFNNWLNYVLDKQEYLPMTLPCVAQNKISAQPKKPKIYLVCFDNPTPIGGIKQLYKMAETLNKLGYISTIIHQNHGFKLDWFSHSIPVVYYPDLYDLLNLSGEQPKLRHTKKYLQYKIDKKFKKTFILPEKNSILMVPEVLGLKISGILDYKIIIYNQNNHYTFLDFPYFEKAQQDPYLHKNVLGIFTVSEYSRDYLSLAYPKKPVFNTGISLNNKFAPSNIPKQKKIAFMPRKLQQDSQQLFQLVQNSEAFKEWEFVAIDNKSEDEVIAILQQSAIFLSFNHIEGFGLPPVEAMACGCYVIGYTGNAGREYFLPEFSTVIPDLDILTFAIELEKLVLDYNKNPEFYTNKGMAASNYVKTKYSSLNELNAVKNAMNSLKL